MTNTQLRWAVSAAILAAAVGCDWRSTPREYVFFPISSVTVNPEQTETVAVITPFEDARAEYAERLRLLQAFYVLEGDVTRDRWARQEHENLTDAQTFKWKGIADATRPTANLAPNDNESTLVEDVIAARGVYLARLGELEEYYRQHSKGNDLEAVLSIRKRFDPVRTYHYLDAAEYPPANLTPTEMIPEADELYNKGYQLYESGKGWLRTFLSTNYDRQRSALECFRDLIRRYPNSDKIALAAFYVGEIHKEYFNEDVRAVHWYELAWTWDPHIQLPARFQAAVVYDHRLKNPLRAMNLYQSVVENEQFDASNVRYAQERLIVLQQELSVSPQVDQAPPPTPEPATPPASPGPSAGDTYDSGAGADDYDAGYFPPASDGGDSGQTDPDGGAPEPIGR